MKKRLIAFAQSPALPGSLMLLLGVGLICLSRWTSRPAPVINAAPEIIYRMPANAPAPGAWLEEGEPVTNSHQVEIPLVWKSSYLSGAPHKHYTAERVVGRVYDDAFLDGASWAIMCFSNQNQLTAEAMAESAAIMRSNYLHKLALPK